MSDIQTTQRREFQLDMISAVLVLGMAAALGLLMYFLSATNVQLPTFLLSDYTPRVLLGGFTILLLLYLADQRRRLRAAVTASVAETEAAKADLLAAVGWLSFAHQAASVLGEEGVEEGLARTLPGAAELFDADAAAVIGDEREWSFIAPNVPPDEADRALMHVALTAAGHSAPMHIQSLGTESGQAIAVPLRVSGELRYLLCLWSRGRGFEPDQLEALGLMGRMIELAIEREELLQESQAQLEGTLQVLQYLVADKRPDYSRHAMQVADLAADVAQQLGMSARDRKDLRLAGLIHDVGMMALPRDIADASQPLSAEEVLVVRQHPRIGAEIAHAANFDDDVREAVYSHHERLNGSGYPDSLVGDEIPLGARILAVCEVFDSMTHREYFGARSTLQDAMNELHGQAGVLYDHTVVAALVACLRAKEANVRLDFGPDAEQLLQIEAAAIS